MAKKPRATPESYNKEQFASAAQFLYRDVCKLIVDEYTTQRNCSFVREMQKKFQNHTLSYFEISLLIEAYDTYKDGILSCFFIWNIIICLIFPI